MKHISEFANVKNLSIAREEKMNETILDPMSNELVNKIFCEFYVICRGFESFYSDEQKLNAEKTLWTVTFSKMGIREVKQIHYGLMHLQAKHTYPNPPSLAEFLEWCKPNPVDIGLPKAYDAFNEAVRNCHPCEIDPLWSHDAVYYAKCQMPSEHLTKLPKEKAFQIYSYHYEIACRKILNGEELPRKPEPKGITHQPKVNPEVAESALSKMKSMLGMK